MDSSRHSDNNTPAPVTLPGPNATAVDTEARTAEFLDIQRSGLSALRSLADGVVSDAESKIEERLRNATTLAESALHDRMAEIEARANADLAALEREQPVQSRPILADFERASTEATESARKAYERVIAEARDHETEADLLLQHEHLLSDTVAQANCERLKNERLAAEKQTAEAYQNFELLRNRIDAQMANLGFDLALADADPQQSPPAEDDPADFDRHHLAATTGLDALERIRDGRIFVGSRMVVVLALFCVAVVGAFAMMSIYKVAGAPPFKVAGPIAGVSALVVSLIFGMIMHRRERTRVLNTYEPLARDFALARQALDTRVARMRDRQQKLEARAHDILRNNPEKVASRRKFDATIAALKKKVADAKTSLQNTLNVKLEELKQRRDDALGGISTESRERIQQVRRRHDQDAATARQECDERIKAARARYDAERALLERDWNDAGAHVRRLLTDGDRLDRALDEPAHAHKPTHPRGEPAVDIEGTVCIGHWQIDWNRLATHVADLAALRAGRSDIDTSPAVLSTRNHCSLLLQTDRAGRQRAIDTIRVAMLRLLTTQPAGRVRFTIIDPVGLGESFAGFMHLVDYQEALVGSRIWTESEHIESRLTELTSHMENVIQKYLRNEFPTIDAYNRQAGPLAEPHRYLVVADFPANFTEGAVRRLTSIINSGARCGVHTLIMHDRRLGLPTGLPLEDLVGNALHLVHNGDRFVAADKLLQHFPLTLDDPPSEDDLTALMHVVGRGAKDAFRVEVPFDAIAPSSEQRWTLDAATQLTIPIGHAGAVRFQNFTLGRGLGQHALMAGKTGSGKSTLMHVIIANLALSYGPDELELYLVDFKKGVEFKTYVTHALPHAKAIAIESDREFGVSVLQRLDAEMTRRGDLFRAAGVQDLPAYRSATGVKLPRTLLIVDEFQVFFSEDDRLAQDASALLDRLVRQGRAFGIHLLLGSQTLAGSAGLARSTIGQMAVRIALQCSEADSQLILDDTNPAARLLSRPGEAIYNDAGGLFSGNSNFQVAWLSDDRQAAHLAEIRELADARGWQGEPAIVFEGNALADLRQNRRAMTFANAADWPAPAAAPHIWLGEPVAIKEPTGVIMRRQSGSNLLVVGQRDDVAQSMLAGSLLCLALQYAPQSAQFIILGGSDDDAQTPGGLRDIAAALPHAIRWVESREVPEVMAELAAESQRRIDHGPANAPSVYVIVLGLQRYRILRRREDTFSFGGSDADAPPATDRQFAELLREGPPVGIHTICWSDTLATIERTLDRQTLREFDSRVLFQMSAADSGNLIDSPEANRLGLYRAILFSEERGVLEKFRPYGPIDAAWLSHLKTLLNRKPRATT